MSEEAIRFLPYETALQLVAAIQEEEDLHSPDRRVLTVYNHEDKAICWFDFDEVMRDAGVKKNDAAAKEQVTRYIMERIPDWAVEI